MKAFDHIQTKDRIARAIRDEILNGNIEPGEELAQEALAEMLGVSRMPVREALQTLVQEGFAVRLPNRHIQAVVLDDRQIRQVFRMAAVMETELAAMAMENGKMEENSAVTAAGEADFHRQIAAMAENPYLEQLYLKIMNGYVTYAIENLGGKEQTLRYLSDASDAFERKDAAAVGNSLEQYYSLYAEMMTERSGR